LIGAGLGIYKTTKYLTKKKVFISFAVEDKNMRDLLVGQSKNEKAPFDFTDMSVKKPWDNAWKTKCRERIKSCHGMIVLLSKNTTDAEGVHWEIKCAKDEGIKVFAIHIDKKNKSYGIPVLLKGAPIRNWTWPNINKFVQNL